MTATDPTARLVDQLRTAALLYASRGWHVFPLIPGQKRPACPGHPAARCDRSDPWCRRGHSGWEQRATTSDAAHPPRLVQHPLRHRDRLRTLPAARRRHRPGQARHRRPSRYRRAERRGRRSPSWRPGTGRRCPRPTPWPRPRAVRTATTPCPTVPSSATPPASSGRWSIPAVPAATSSPHPP